MKDSWLLGLIPRSINIDQRAVSSFHWPVWMCWLCCPCWLCWLAFGCIAACGWAGCCGAPGGVGCWTWGCGWAAPWGGMTPVAAKNWLMEEHRSAIWAASSDQLLSSACRMLSFKPGSQTQETDLDWDVSLWSRYPAWTQMLHYVMKRQEEDMEVSMFCFLVWIFTVRPRSIWIMTEF